MTDSDNSIGFTPGQGGAIFYQTEDGQTHIKCCFRAKKLMPESTIRKFRIVRQGVC